MPKRLPDEMRMGPIRTADDARKWIRLLHKHELAFHFDDDPATIYAGGSDELLFHEDDVPLVRARTNELFNFDFCPFAFALALGWASCMSHEWEDPNDPHKRCKKCGYDSETAAEAWR